MGCPSAPGPSPLWAAALAACVRGWPVEDDRCRVSWPAFTLLARFKERSDPSTLVHILLWSSRRPLPLSLLVSVTVAFSFFVTVSMLLCLFFLVFVPLCLSLPLTLCPCVFDCLHRPFLFFVGSSCVCVTLCLFVTFVLFESLGRGLSGEGVGRCQVPRGRGRRRDQV